MNFDLMKKICEQEENGIDVEINSKTKEEQDNDIEQEKRKIDQLAQLIVDRLNQLNTKLNYGSDEDENEDNYNNEEDEDGKDKSVEPDEEEGVEVNWDTEQSSDDGEGAD